MIRQLAIWHAHVHSRAAIWMPPHFLNHRRRTSPLQSSSKFATANPPLLPNLPPVRICIRLVIATIKTAVFRRISVLVFEGSQLWRLQSSIDWVAGGDRGQSSLLLSCSMPPGAHGQIAVAGGPAWVGAVISIAILVFPIAVPHIAKSSRHLLVATVSTLSPPFGL